MEACAGGDLSNAPPDCPVCVGLAEWYDGRPEYAGHLARCVSCGMSYKPDGQAAYDVVEAPMTDKDRDKVVGHALDHIAYGWAPGLPVRHDLRRWTRDETRLYYKTYREASGG